MSPHSVVSVFSSGEHSTLQSEIWLSALSKRQYCCVYLRWTMGVSMLEEWLGAWGMMVRERESARDWGFGPVWAKTYT